MNDSTQGTSWWKRLSGGLKRTSASLGGAIADLVIKRKLDVGAIEALEDGLEAATAISGRNSGLASLPALLLAEVYYERNELEAARDEFLGGSET